MRMNGFVMTAVSLVTSLTMSETLARSLPADLDPTSNAALQYWQAFALMPPGGPDQEKILKNWRAAPLDAEAVKLSVGFEAVRKYFLRASRLKTCDWGLDYGDGQFLQLPYLAQSQRLANLAALHARVEFDRKRWASGAEDVVALLHLARHLEAEPIMVVQMLGFKFEAMALDAAAPFLKAGGASLIGPLVEGLERLPGRPAVSRVILREKELCVSGLVHRLKQEEERAKGSWREVWKPLEQDTSTPVATLEQAVAAMESLTPFFDRLAAEAALPWPEFDPSDDAYTQRLKAANKLAYVYLASMVMYVGAERRAVTRLELFRAAIEVARRGPDALKGFKDPAGDGREPFRYREDDDGGFTLSSKLPDAPSSRFGPRSVSVTVEIEPAAGGAKPGQRSK